MTSETIKAICQHIRQAAPDAARPIVCRSGLCLSVQAGEGIYSTPRHMAGYWSAVEVGFPSRRVMALAPYREAGGKLTETVYPYVPIDLVARVIERNGGFA